MRRRMKFTAIILGMTLAVCGCQGGAEQQTETKQDGSQTAGDTENSTEEATDAEELSDNAAAQESDVVREEQEEIQVSLEGVAITRPDNWEVLSFDELTGKAVYGIEQDGTVHEVTLYTMDDVALHGNTVTNAVTGQTFTTLAEKFQCHDYSMVVMGNEQKGYVATVFYLDNRSRQISCLVGDDRTLVMESDVSTVTDEVAANVAFSYDSEDASQTVSFPTTEFCAECETEGSPNYYGDGEEELLATADDEKIAGENSSTEQKEQTQQTQTQEEVVADTSEYIYYSDTSGPIDLTNTTIVRDGNPNYVITRNGPGPIVKSSYPYIGVNYYGMDEQGEIHTLLVQSTDYYGCPYEIVYDGTPYTFTNRVYNRTEPENDVSSWGCDYGDMSMNSMVTVCVKRKYIIIDGPWMRMTFWPKECFADPSVVPE